jgi:hypothetical protein
MVACLDMPVCGVLQLTDVFLVTMAAFRCVALHVVLQALREVDPPSFQQLFSRKDVQVGTSEG